MTPTVVSRPVPASATANSARTIGAAAEQERRVHGAADEQRAVDGGLEADRDAGQHDGGGAGERALADLHDGLAGRLGEVAGEDLDRGRQHDADDHGADREHPRVAVQRLHAEVAVVELRERRRQVGERGDRDEHGGHDRGQEEAPVDGVHAAAVALAGAGGVDADQGRQHADRRDDEREDQALGPEGRLAEDQRRDQRDRVGLEQVRGHARAVTDVVADVVGDRRGVAGVVLGDALLDLADEVGADVRSLGEDAAADTHEHREQGRAEGEALEHVRRVLVEAEQDDGRTQQAEADGEHADDAAGAERDPRGAPLAGGVGRVGDAQVGARRERHADEADQGREQRPDEEEHRAEHPDAGAVGRQQEQQHEDESGEDGQGRELPSQVRGGALLDRLGDLDHLRRALALREDLPGEQAGEDEGDDRDGEDAEHEALVAVGQGGERRSRPGRGGALTCVLLVRGGSRRTSVPRQPAPPAGAADAPIGRGGGSLTQRTCRTSHARRATPGDGSGGGGLRGGGAPGQPSAAAASAGHGGPAAAGARPRPRPPGRTARPARRRGRRRRPRRRRRRLLTPRRAGRRPGRRRPARRRARGRRPRP